MVPIDRSFEFFIANYSPYLEVVDLISEYHNIGRENFIVSLSKLLSKLDDMYTHAGSQESGPNALKFREFPIDINVTLQPTNPLTVDIEITMDDMNPPEIQSARCGMGDKTPAFMVDGLEKAITHLPHGIVMPGPFKGSAFTLHCPAHFALFLANVIDDHDIQHSIYTCIFSKPSSGVGVFNGMSLTTTIVVLDYIGRIGTRITDPGLPVSDEYKIALPMPNRLANAYRIVEFLAVYESDYRVCAEYKYPIDGFRTLAFTEYIPKMYSFSGITPSGLISAVESDAESGKANNKTSVIVTFGKLYLLGIGAGAYQPNDVDRPAWARQTNVDLDVYIHNFIDKVFAPLHRLMAGFPDIMIEIYDRYVLETLRETTMRVFLYPDSQPEKGAYMFPFANFWEPFRGYKRIASMNTAARIGYVSGLFSTLYFTTNALNIISECIEDTVGVGMSPHKNLNRHLNDLLVFIDIATEATPGDWAQCEHYTSQYAGVDGHTRDMALANLVEMSEFHNGYVDIIYAQHLYSIGIVRHFVTGTHDWEAKEKIDAIMRMSSPISCEWPMQLPVCMVIENTMYGDICGAWDALRYISLYIRNAKQIAAHYADDVAFKFSIQIVETPLTGNQPVQFGEFLLQTISDLVLSTTPDVVDEYRRDRHHYHMGIPVDAVIDILEYITREKWCIEYPPTIEGDKDALLPSETVRTIDNILYRLFELTPRTVERTFLYTTVRWCALTKIIEANIPRYVEIIADACRENPEFLIRDNTFVIHREYEADVLDTIDTLQVVAEKYRKQKTGRADANRIAETIYDVIYTSVRALPEIVSLQQDTAVEIFRAVRDAECGDVENPMQYRECIDSTCELSFGYDAGSRIPGMTKLNGDGEDWLGICGVYDISAEVAYATGDAIDSINSFLMGITDRMLVKFLNYVTEVSGATYRDIRFQRTPELIVHRLPLETAYKLRMYVYRAGPPKVEPGSDVFDAEASEVQTMYELSVKKFHRGSFYKAMSPEDKKAFDELMTAIPKPKRISEKLVISNRSADMIRVSACQGWTSCFSIEKQAACESAPHEYIEDNNYVAYIASDEFSPEWHSRVILLQCVPGRANVAIQTAFGVNEGYEALITDAVRLLLFEAGVGRNVTPDEKGRVPKCEPLRDYSCVESREMFVASLETIDAIYAQRGDDFLTWDHPLTVDYEAPPQHINIGSYIEREFVGYRIEGYSGSDVRDLAAIIDYEDRELGNSDIHIYISQRFKVPTSEFVKALKQEGFANAVWLCRSAEDAAEYYGEPDDSIDKYYITNAIIVDEIPDGVLVAYRDTPEIEDSVAIVNDDRDITYLD